MEAGQEVAHIDELLNIESGSKVKSRRNARHQMTARIGKARKKEANSDRNAKQTEARKWEMQSRQRLVNGERMGRSQWLDGSARASASGTIERRIRIETKTTAKSLKAECLAIQSRSIWTIGRWKPNLRGHDPQGVTSYFRR